MRDRFSSVIGKGDPLRSAARYRCLVGGILGLILAACASTPKSDGADGIDHSGRMRGYVESSRVTDFCPDQSQRRDDERCVVTRGWDYTRGLTIVRTYDPSGKIIDTDEPHGAELSLTPVEQARVESLARADLRTRDLVSAPQVVFWSIGFALREPGDPFCDRGSRCIHVIAAVDNGNTTVLHSVVDLMSDRVVYPNYIPSGKKTAIQGEEH